MAEQPVLTGGISTTEQKDYTPSDLAPNNYLTIIWKNKQGEQFNSLDINDEQAIQFTNDLNNAIEQGISSGKKSYIGSTKYVNVESIAKYLAQNIIPDSPKQQIANGLIGLATGSTNKLPDETINLIVNVFGEVAEKTARQFGFSDPHEVFASFASENTIKLLRSLGDKAGDFIQDKIAKFTHKAKSTVTSKISKESKQYVGLIMGVTTSDTESYEISIPRKKVEDGSDYTTHLLPQPFKKDFNVKLTNKVLSSDYNRTLEIENIEKVKDKLIEIAQSRILFDVYIRLSSDKCYKRSNVYFSSLNFTKDESSGNGYECSFTIEPITEFKTKIFVSNRKYFPTASKSDNIGSSKGTGSGSRSGSGYGNSSNGKNKNGRKTANGNKLTVGWDNGLTNGVQISNQSLLKNANLTREQMLKHARNNGYYIFESNNTNPKYVFIRPLKVIKTINGPYALFRDTITIPDNNLSNAGTRLSNDLRITKGGWISNGKTAYRIIKP